MKGGHHFKRLAPPRPRPVSVAHANWRALRKLLAHRVVARFARLRGAHPVAIPLVLARHAEDEEPPINPGHPACRKHAHSSYCRESWQLHLAELCLRPQTHWHQCDYSKFCALVPLVQRGHCLAAIKLVCAASRPEAEFARHVEFMELLVRDFVAVEARFLEGLPVLEVAPSPSAGHRAPRHLTHPQIRRAIQYIERQLPNPRLTVGVVAREMGVHPNYLSHLFVDQVGERMSRFIMARRVALAKSLLGNTSWQIKRIARDTGHANPGWFSHIFAEFTGLTPGAFRKKIHRPD